MKPLNPKALNPAIPKTLSGGLLRLFQNLISVLWVAGLLKRLRQSKRIVGSGSLFFNNLAPKSSNLF